MNCEHCNLSLKNHDEDTCMRVVAYRIRYGVFPNV